ncbi:MAG: copper amine oxidase N-terminal domain-containing protein [Bacillota bacterium]|nr:copper amine oxidase N-terminal domain-containing protein [Bacillota bacterium]
MKKALLYTVILITVCIFTTNLYADKKEVVKEIPTLKVIIDGNQLKPSSIPINYEGRVLVGLRDLLVALGVQNDSEHIIWDQDNKTIKVSKDSKEINLVIGSNKAIVDGAEVNIDAAPIIYKNSTYIPARFIAQSLSKLVFWDSYTNSVVMCDEENYKEIENIFDSEKSSNKVVFKTTTDSLSNNGKNVYTTTNEITYDPSKNIEATSSKIESEGQVDYISYFENDKYYYSKPDGHEKWLRISKSDKKADEGEIDLAKQNKNDSMNAFMASMVVTEKNDERILIEGSTLYFAVSMTKGSEMDVLKDKTSTSKVVLEYNASTNSLNKIEVSVEGNISNSSSKKSYELKRITVINNDDSITSVTVPEDLNNFYTVPKGYKEYYNFNIGCYLVVPDTWITPGMIEKSPVVLYLDPKDSKKWCSIIPEKIYFGLDTKPSLSTTSTEVIKNLKKTFSNTKVLKNEKIKFKGFDAVRITLKGIDTKTKVSSKIQVTLFQEYNTVTILIYMGEEKTFDAKSSEAKKIIDSWENPGKG